MSEIERQKGVIAATTAFIVTLTVALMVMGEPKAEAGTSAEPRIVCEGARERSPCYNARGDFVGYYSAMNRHYPVVVQ